MSATRYLVNINGTTLVQRSRKEQAMTVFTAEATNTENLVELVTSSGKILETNRPGQMEITHTVEASAPAVEVFESVAAAAEALAADLEDKEPVTAPETTDDALEFLKAEIEATAAKRAALENAEQIPSPLPALEAAMTPASVASDAVPLTKRPKASSSYTIRVTGEPEIHVAGGKPKANKEFDLQVKAHPAAVISMATAKGSQVRYYDGPLVQAAEVNAANPTAPLVTPARPSRKRTAAKPVEAPKAPARKVAAKKSPLAPKAAPKAAKPAPKVDGRKTPAAPRYRPAPGTVRDQVKAFLDRKENHNKSFTSVQIMHALGRDNGVNNISTTLADRGEIAWASKPGEVKHFTSNKSTRLLKKLGLADAAKARQTGVKPAALAAAAKKVAAPHIEAGRRAGRKVTTAK